jgi:uncharacterized protein
MSSPLIVQQLVVYPVKSCRGIVVDRWDVESRGLRHDRRFMVVTRGGAFLTQRELPALCQIETAIDPAGERLTLRREGHGGVALPLAPEGGAPVAVQIWGEPVDARTVGDDVDAWLAAALGEPVRLVYFPETSHRATEAAYGEGFETAFADGYPVLILGQASLDDLNARLATPVPMDRFRPNIVVAGSAPFAEDEWRDVTCGEVELRIVKPCDRCVITTTDQQTMVRGQEPLRTLAMFRRDEGKVLFGQNAVVIREGGIRVGDSIVPRDR